MVVRCFEADVANTPYVDALVLDRGVDADFRPGFTTVAGREDFAIVAGADEDLIGVARMQRNRHDGAVDLDLVEA